MAPSSVRAPLLSAPNRFVGEVPPSPPSSGPAEDPLMLELVRSPIPLDAAATAAATAAAAVSPSQTSARLCTGPGAETLEGTSTVAGTASSSAVASAFAIALAVAVAALAVVGGSESKQSVLHGTRPRTPSTWSHTWPPALPTIDASWERVTPGPLRPERTRCPGFAAISLRSETSRMMSSERRKRRCACGIAAFVASRSRSAPAPSSSSDAVNVPRQLVAVGYERRLPVDHKGQSLRSASWRLHASGGDSASAAALDSAPALGRGGGR